MAAIASARIAARDVLRLGDGLPWAALLVVAIAASRAGATPIVRGAIQLSLGFVAAAAIAAFAPIALAGRKRGRAANELVAARPLSPWARAAGPALGSAAAAFAVAALFVATLPLSGADLGGLMRARIAEPAASPGESTEVAGHAPAGGILRLAPRIGWASGFGGSAAVKLRVELEPSSSWEVELKGRMAFLIPIPKDQDFRIRVTKVGAGPLVRWIPGSVAVLAPPLGAAELALRLLLAAAPLLLLLASAGSLLASSLERSVAAAGIVSVAVSVAAGAGERVVSLLGLEAPFSLDAWFEGIVDPLPLGATLRCVAASAILLALAALVRRRLR